MTTYSLMTGAELEAAYLAAVKAYQAATAAMYRSPDERALLEVSIQAAADKAAIRQERRARSTYTGNPAN